MLQTEFFKEYIIPEHNAVIIVLMNGWLWIGLVCTGASLTLGGARESREGPDVPRVSGVQGRQDPRFGRKVFVSVTVM